jgi:hypothetical protein
MDSTSIAVTGAVASAIIAAVAGLTGGALTGRWQARLEREKWLRGVSDSFTTELRSYVGQLTTKLAEAAHSMCWLCWLAKFGVDRLTLERIAAYDQEMHVLLPQITGLHGIIAGLDYSVYLEIKPFVERLVKLDLSVADAGLSFVPGVMESAESLSRLYPQVSELENSLAEVVSEAMRPYSITSRTLKSIGIR